jgi:Sugar (and other) transporter
VKNEGEEQGGPSMLESFTDPAYRRATIMGCLMMVFQQLSGINVLIFYSSNIFINLGKSGAQGAAVINFSNMAGAFAGMALLTKMGRKISLVLWTFFMASFMVAMGVVYNMA